MKLLLIWQYICMHLSHVANYALISFLVGLLLRIQVLLVMQFLEHVFQGFFKLTLDIF